MVHVLGQAAADARVHAQLGAIHLDVCKTVFVSLLQIEYARLSHAVGQKAAREQDRNELFPAGLTDDEEGDSCDSDSEPVEAPRVDGRLDIGTPLRAAHAAADAFMASIGHPVQRRGNGEGSEDGE